MIHFGLDDPARYQDRTASGAVLVANWIIAQKVDHGSSAAAGTAPRTACWA